MHSNTWSPPQHITVKALGLHWREGKLLAMEVFDDQAQLIGVRPLGGGIEFGEHWQSALKREFKEELGVDIQIKGSPLVFENIFEREGVAGHEVLFISEVLFSDEQFKAQSTIKFHEDNGTPCTAQWFDLADLDLPSGPALFPAGLKTALTT